MKITTPKVIVVLEIDQSKYLDDEDYTGLDTKELKDRQFLARLLDEDCYYSVRVLMTSQSASGTPMECTLEFDQGYNDGYNGTSYINPYSEGSKEHTAYLTGWKEGKRDRPERA